MRGAGSYEIRRWPPIVVNRLHGSLTDLQRAAIAERVGHAFAQPGIGHHLVGLSEDAEIRLAIAALFEPVSADTGLAAPAK